MTKINLFFVLIFLKLLFKIKSILFLEMMSFFSSKMVKISAFDFPLINFASSESIFSTYYRIGKGKIDRSEV